MLIVDNGGDNEFYDNAAWIEPKLSGPKKIAQLTELEWTSATTGWGAVAVDRTVDGQPLTWDGAKASGIGTHSVSAIAYDLPEGYDQFTARGVVTPTVGGTASLQFLVLVDPREARFPEQSPVSVYLRGSGHQGASQSPRSMEARGRGCAHESLEQRRPPQERASVSRVSLSPQAGGRLRLKPTRRRRKASEGSDPCSGAC